jgi:hypothetical protein
MGTRSRVVCWGTMVHAGRLSVRFETRSLDFSVHLILPAALWPWGRLSHPWADCLENVGALTSHNTNGLHGLLHGYVYLFLRTLYGHRCKILKFHKAQYICKQYIIYSDKERHCKYSRTRRIILLKMRSKLARGKSKQLLFTRFVFSSGCCELHFSYRPILTNLLS